MDYTDRTIVITLRGDEVELLNKLIEETDWENQARLSLLCYLRNQITEQLGNR